MKRGVTQEKHRPDRKACNRVKRWAGAALLATACLMHPKASNAEEDKKSHSSYETSKINAEFIKSLDKEFHKQGEENFREIYKEEIADICSCVSYIEKALEAEVSEEFLRTIILSEIKEKYLFDNDMIENNYKLFDPNNSVHPSNKTIILRHIAEKFFPGITEDEKKINIGYALLYLSKDEVTKLREELGIEYFARYPPEILENCFKVLENKKQDEGQKLLFVVGGKGDWNGAFYHYHDLDQFKDKGYDFLIVEVSDSKELEKKLLWFADNMEGPADVLEIRAHGKPDSFQLEESYYLGTSKMFLFEITESYFDSVQAYKKENEVLIFEKKRKIIKKGGVILFASCSTGKNDYGIAAEVSELLGARSFAPKDDAWISSVGIKFNWMSELIGVEYKNENGVVDTASFYPDYGQKVPPTLADFRIEPVTLYGPFEYLRQSMGGLFSGSTRLHMSFIDENIQGMGKATKGGNSHFFFSSDYFLRFQIKKLLLGAYFSGNVLSGTSSRMNINALPTVSKLAGLITGPVILVCYLPKEDEKRTDKNMDFSGGAFIGWRTDWNKKLGELQLSAGGGYSSAGDFALVSTLYLRHYNMEENGYIPSGRLELIIDGYVSGIHEGISVLELSSHLNYRYKNIGAILSAYGGKMSNSEYFSGDLELYWIYKYPGYLSNSFGGSWSRLDEEWLKGEFWDIYTTLNTGVMLPTMKFGIGAGIGMAEGEPHFVLNISLTPVALGFISEMAYQSI